MSENIFEQCGTTYEDILNVVKSIAKKIVNLYGVYDYKDELVSAGMLAAVECLNNFDHSRNAKATSYIYRAVFGRLKRLAYDQKQYIHTQDKELVHLSAIRDSSRAVPVFFTPDPYRLRPDVIYDAKRKQKVVQKAFDKHTDEIEKYVRVVEREHGTVPGRARIKRERERCVVTIRRTINHVLMLNRPLSAVSAILEEFAEIEKASIDEIERERQRKEEKRNKNKKE